MSALHLFWIVPLSMALGTAIEAVMVVSARESRREEKRKHE